MTAPASGTAEGFDDIEPLGLFPTIDQRLAVTFRYRVLFTEDVFAADNPLLAKTLASMNTDTPCRFVCVVDNGVVRHRPGLVASIQAYARRYRELVWLVEPPQIVPGGEQVKNAPELVTAVQDAINRGGICRQSFVVAVGGGAVLDMVGYAAATAHRGVRLVRIPTTVL